MLKLSTKWIRIIKTCNLYLAFFTLGLAVALVGPCLLDLQRIVNTDTQHIALIFTARSTGYLLGAVVGGIVLDIIQSRQAVLVVCCSFVAGTMLGIPWSRSFGTLLGYMIVNGLCLGAIETGGNVICLNLWGKDSGPLFQGLHFTFGLGGLISPLIAAPYLEEYGSGMLTADNRTTTVNSTSNFSNSSLPLFAGNNSTISSNMNLMSFTNSTSNTLYNSSRQTATEGIPGIIYPFSFIGSFAFLIVGLLAVVCIMSPTEEARKDNDKKDNSKRSLGFMFTVVILNFLLIFVGCGIEIGYAQMLTSYAVKGSLHLTTKAGSYVTSAFWSAFTVSRLASVFLAIKFKNETLLVGDVILVSIAALMLLFLMPNEWVLWLASVIFGIGIASFYPSAVGWLDTRINVTNKIASIFTVGAAAGEMVVPFIISYFIESVPEIFAYVVAIGCVLSSIMIYILYMFLKKCDKKTPTKQHEIYIIRTSSINI